MVSFPPTERQSTVKALGLVHEYEDSSKETANSVPTCETGIESNFDIHRRSLDICSTFSLPTHPTLDTTLAKSFDTSLASNHLPDLFQNLLSPKINRLQRPNPIVRAPTTMTAITAATHAGATAIVLVIVAHGAALDAALRVGFADAVADGIAAGTARAALLLCFGAHRDERVRVSLDFRA